MAKTCARLQSSLAGRTFVRLVCERSVTETSSDFVVRKVLDFPKHPISKEYVSSYRGLPGCMLEVAV
eukprot:4627473-Amphidinium_carterae.1